MLVPLLGFVGLLDDGGPTEGIGVRIAEFFQILGLPQTLPVVLLAFLALMGLREGLQRLHSTCNAALQHGFVLQLRRQLYGAITNADWLFFTRTRVADFAQVLSADITRVGEGTYAMLQLASTLVLLSAYLAVACLFSPLMTGLAVVSGAFLLLLLRSRTHRARNSGEAFTRSSQFLLGAIVEHLSGMKVAKSFRAEGRHGEIFARFIQDLQDATMAFTRTSASANMWFSLGSAAIFCSYLYIAIETFAIEAVSLLLLLYVFARMMPQILSVQKSCHLLAYMLPAFESFRNMLERCTAAAEVLPGEGGGRPLEEHIRLTEVCFRYQSEQEEGVLRAVDLYIEAHKTTALVGPSGAGKSTLADLLMGLFMPDQGQVEVDGSALEAGDLWAWRQGIGYVPQETFLFHDTVRVNLEWARPGASEDEIWEALDLAAAGFVRQLPRRLETEIGERGVRLSGGERQRLALARALLIKPKLLILDEATSHLDVENEKVIQQALDELSGQFTMVIIAHRLSTVRNADQIVVLEAGRVVESGDWETLQSDKGGRLYSLSRAHVQSLE